MLLILLLLLGILLERGVRGESTDLEYKRELWSSLAGPVLKFGAGVAKGDTRNEGGSGK